MVQKSGELIEETKENCYRLKWIVGNQIQLIECEG